MEQLAGSVRVFLQHCAGDEVIYEEGGEMTHIVKVPLTSEKCLCVNGKLLGVHCDELGTVWDCYIRRIDLEKDVEMLRKPTIEAFSKDRHCHKDAEL